MTVQVVTGFHPAGYEQYGKRMVETFDQYWPKHVELAVYVEEPVPLPRGELRYLKDCPGWTEFYARHRDHPDRCGRAEHAGHPWRSKEKAAGYSYRFDAVKFGRMAFYVEDAARLVKPETEWLVWFDGDTYTHKRIPNDWIEQLMGDADFATLFRESKHPEIGIQIYRIQNVAVRQLIRSYYLMYHKDIFLEVDEWHSAHLLGQLAEGSKDGIKLEPGGLQVPAMKIKNLTWGKKGHVWHESPLAEYTDHLKGDSRKRAGVSRERRR